MVHVTGVMYGGVSDVCVAAQVVVHIDGVVDGGGLCVVTPQVVVHGGLCHFVSAQLALVVLEQSRGGRDRSCS